MPDSDDSRKNEPETVTKQNNDAEASTSIDKVSIPFPPYWHQMPEVWFIQIESLFAIKKIKKDNRYYHALAALPGDVIYSIQNVINDPSLENLPDKKYELLKSTLIKSKSLTAQERMEQLLSTTDLGNQKPSELFNKMKIIAGNSNFSNDELLRTLWFKRLPQQIQTVLAASDGSPITTQCDIADKVWNIINPTNPFINAISNASDPKDSLKLHTLTQSINELRSRFDKFTASTNTPSSNNRSQFHGRSNSGYNRSGSRSRQSGSRGRLVNGKCWYHRKFGRRARKCGGYGCTFNNNQVTPNTGSGNSYNPTS